jgi:predicted nucleic acid-binding protein
VYWDSSCFISLLSAQHPAERDRAVICQDVLHHAQNDYVEIWTSVWTIVETIRPKEDYQPTALPAWSEALRQIDKSGSLIYPSAISELEKVWNYYDRHTLPTRKLSKQQSEKIQQMFAWPFIKTVQIEQTSAYQAAEIARECNMKAADSLHVASAIARKCGVIQRWDRDYEKTDHLIRSEEPKMMTPQQQLPGIVPPHDPAAFRLI